MGKRKKAGKPLKRSKRTCNPSPNLQQNPLDENNEAEGTSNLQRFLQDQDASPQMEIAVPTEIDGYISEPSSPALPFPLDQQQTTLTSSTTDGKNTSTDVTNTEPLVNQNDIQEGEPCQDSSQQVSRTSIEVIDVDKLPDIPDSPIGDEVIEIFSTEQKDSPSSSSNKTKATAPAQFVDLTEIPDHSPTENQQQQQPWDGSAVQDQLETELVRPRSEEKSKKKEDDIPPALFSSKENVSAAPSSSKYSATTITCPVCQDDLDQIKKDSRKVMSTVCGHIFCNECVKLAVETQRRCPTCRRKLKKSQFHPIFI